VVEDVGPALNDDGVLTKATLSPFGSRMLRISASDRIAPHLLSRSRFAIAHWVSQQVGMTSNLTAGVKNISYEGRNQACRR
jgi:hypothetical protein